MEIIAHLALILGSAGIACGLISSCAALVEALTGIGTGLCADGNCTNEINVSAQLGQNVWELEAKVRGWIIEKVIGRGPNLQISLVQIMEAVIFEHP